MATLTPTLTLASTDVTSETLSLSVTDSLSVTGDVINISRVGLTTGDLTLIAAATYTKSYVYLKNTDSSIVITADFGSTLSISLAAGEFAFFPWEGSQNVVVAAASGTPVLEYALFEA
tara:strand:+ start:238 stop:591 length:354 start_codon:yes stop_codon:yes gene_type:complete